MPNPIGFLATGDDKKPKGRNGDEDRPETIQDIDKINKTRLEKDVPAPKEKKKSSPGRPS